MPLPPRGSEAARIAFLLARDGFAATQAWVQRTRAIYRAALASPSSHAAMPEYRRRFEASVREFEAWLQSAAARDTQAADRTQGATR
ncbi:MAG: hypothetical protein R3357_14910 [Burkholderiales bacterium]|nr:hypothetical protein [Burkholderiales bacterium]